MVIGNISSVSKDLEIGLSYALYVDRFNTSIIYNFATQSHTMSLLEASLESSFLILNDNCSETFLKVIEASGIKITPAIRDTVSLIDNPSDPRIRWNVGWQKI